MPYLAVLIFIFIMSGCATTRFSLSADDIYAANKVCADNDGLSHIEPKYSNTVRAICNNGAKFIITKDKTDEA